MNELDRYDYPLPRELIAQMPAPRRSDARLMVVHRGAQRIGHYHVRDLPELLRAGDVVVLNDTRVIPARLVGQRSLTGGHWEGLFLAEDGQGNWRVLCRTRGKPEPGETVNLVSPREREELQLRLVLKEPQGTWIVRPLADDETLALLERVGRVPLPHYIRDGKMVDADRQRYQTVYAEHPGSVAAPTAGLHFTSDLLRQIEQAGVSVARVTLHVGVDTFRPIAGALAAHRMHSEWGRLDAEALARIQEARHSGGRVVAVGTTSVRVLETAAAEGSVQVWQGATNLFIRPPYQFRTVDTLLTNFHLPRTTLLVLVRTFGGDELVRRAYDEAVAQRYRFFSYGDAMLIL